MTKKPITQLKGEVDNILADGQQPKTITTERVRTLTGDIIDSLFLALADGATTQAGTDDTTAVSPLRLAQLLAEGVARQMLTLIPSGTDLAQLHHSDAGGWINVLSGNTYGGGLPAGFPQGSDRHILITMRFDSESVGFGGGNGKQFLFHTDTSPAPSQIWQRSLERTNSTGATQAGAWEKISPRTATELGTLLATLPNAGNGKVLGLVNGALSFVNMTEEGLQVDGRLEVETNRQMVMQTIGAGDNLDVLPTEDGFRFAPYAATTGTAIANGDSTAETARNKAGMFRAFRSGAFIIQTLIQSDGEQIQRTSTSGGATWTSWGPPVENIALTAEEIKTLIVASDRDTRQDIITALRNSQHFSDKADVFADGTRADFFQDMWGARTTPASSDAITLPLDIEVEALVSGLRISNVRLELVHAAFSGGKGVGTLREDGLFDASTNADNSVHTTRLGTNLLRFRLQLGNTSDLQTFLAAGEIPQLQMFYTANGAEETIFFQLSRKQIADAQLTKDLHGVGVRFIWSSGFGVVADGRLTLDKDGRITSAAGVAHQSAHIIVRLPLWSNAILQKKVQLPIGRLVSDTLSTRDFSWGLGGSGSGDNASNALEIIDGDFGAALDIRIINGLSNFSVVNANVRDDTSGETLMVYLSNLATNFRKSFILYL